MRLLTAFLALGLIFAAPGCTQLRQVYDHASSAEVSRNDALVLVSSVQALQDVATAAIETCVATKSTKGVCAPSAVNAVHKALVAARGPRDDLLDFVDTHAGSPLGAGGLYDALVLAKNNLLAVLTQYGVVTPTN